MFFFFPLFVSYKRIIFENRKYVNNSNKTFLFYKKKVEFCTWLKAQLDTNLLTFLLTKHFMDYDNIFLKDFSYS